MNYRDLEGRDKIKIKHSDIRSIANRDDKDCDYGIKTFHKGAACIFRRKGSGNEIYVITHSTIRIPTLSIPRSIIKLYVNDAKNKRDLYVIEEQGEFFIVGRGVNQKLECFKENQ